MRKLLKLVFLVLIVTGLVWLGRMIWWRWHYPPNTYYGVFLTNGQVYFGHIRQLNQTTIALTDVYYLQANQPVTDWTEDTPQEQIDLQVALIKLGNEIHGPQDTMFIERNQVIFYEPLRDDGRVVEAIRNYRQ
jgi:hypothetical protein